MCLYPWLSPNKITELCPKLYARAKHGRKSRVSWRLFSSPAWRLAFSLRGACRSRFLHVSVSDRAFERWGVFIKMCTLGTFGALCHNMKMNVLLVLGLLYSTKGLFFSLLLFYSKNLHTEIILFHLLSHGNNSKIISALSSNFLFYIFSSENIFQTKSLFLILLKDRNQFFYILQYVIINQKI